ncbi:hypothetical protein SAMN04487957_11092 [Halomonas shengliensis]|uniref:Uncharacterized protein n=1 Tax=Halomonas shengliensis TaxID=419597 RepID=A0A1H0LSW7_9GAMM|nr:hypothetical protein [Halomonas shengliensis]SDO71224.1 hypothetical protein SAMN04487957_11092 [Halomonas shengliensis]
MSLQALLNTSVSDAQISLEGMLAHRTAEAATLALDLLIELRGKEGQAARRKMAAAIVRKAAKAMEGEA